MPRSINEAWITATAGGGGTLFRKVGQDGVTKLEVEDDILNPGLLRVTYAPGTPTSRNPRMSSHGSGKLPRTVTVDVRNWREDPFEAALDTLARIKNRRRAVKALFTKLDRREAEIRLILDTRDPNPGLNSKDQLVASLSRLIMEDPKNYTNPNTPQD